MKDTQYSMKIIGIGGSARKNGNSASLMRSVLNGAVAAGADAKEIYLNSLVFKGCQGCLKCTQSGKCILHDDLTPVLEELRQADVWILASPIYYDGITGQMKTFFDRCRTFTKEPRTQKQVPQLEGLRQALIIMTYAIPGKEVYMHEARKLEKYIKWMGDFRNVQILPEGSLKSCEEMGVSSELLSEFEELGKNLCLQDVKY